MGLTQRLGTIPLAIQTDSSNNVGIGGAANASYKLAVTGASLFSSSVQIQSSNGIKLNRSANDYYWQINSDSSNYLNFGAYLANGTAYGTNPKMILLDNGNVGIGSSNTDPLSLGRERNLAIVTTGTSAALTIVGGNNGRIDFGVGTTRTAGMYSDTTNFTEIFTSTALPLVLSTNNTERMRITSAGNVMIGSTGDSGYKFDVRGQSYFEGTNTNCLTAQRLSSDGFILTFYKNGTLVGSISTNANSLPSDLNFKKNINNLELGLNLVSKLRPVSYNHKIDDEGAALSTGFIAQELEQSLTELGVEQNQYYILQHQPNEDETQSQYWLDYTKMIPVLVKAIQELNAKVTALENK